MESHFMPLADVAPGLCKTKKTLENLVGPDGQIRLGEKRLPTVKIGATRVVARVHYEALILELLEEAGVSPAAAARLVRASQTPPEEVTSSSPSVRRPGPGRPRDVAKGGAK